MALTAEQLEERRAGIGGSDVPAILGLSPWKSPLDVFLEKTGQAPPQPETAATYWGSVLEDIVAQEYARRTGAKLRRVNRILTHPKVPVARAMIDREIVAHPEGPGVLECKTAGRRTDDWGEPGTDEVPPWYASQIIHYLAVTGRDWADLAVLFLSEREFAIYRVRRDEELIEHILAEEQRFWREHVEAGVPPPPRSLEDIRKLWPRDDGSEAVASPEVEAAIQRLRQIREESKRLREAEQEAKAVVQEAMGTAAVLVAPDGRRLATWKASRDTTVTDWRAVAEALKAAVPEAVWEQAVAEHTETRPGARRFLVK